MKNKPFLITLVVAAILFILLWRQCNKTTQQGDISFAISDTLTLTRDSLGRQTAKISVITAFDKRGLLMIRTKDSTIKALKTLVAHTKGLLSATILSNSTANVVRSASNITGRDTVIQDSLIYLYPVYSTNFKNRWEDFIITADKDTFDINYTLFNEFEITQAREKRIKGLFKRKVPVITIKNMNPNTETRELRSFAIKPHPRRMSLGVGVYYGFSIPTLKPSLILGGGVQYNLIGR